MLHLHRKFIVNPRLERLLIATTLAGAACWSAWGVVRALGLVGPYHVFGAMLVSLSLTVGVAATWRAEVRRITSVVVTLAACVPLWLWFGSYPAFALLASGAVASLAVPGPWTPLVRVNAALALGVGAFAGYYVAAALAAVPVLTRIPPIVLPAILGAASGFVAAFGHVATRVRCESDTVELLFRAERKRAPVPPLAVQALHLYRRVREALPPDAGDETWAGVRQTVSRLVLQVLGLARQAQEMAEDVALSDVDELTRRAQAMRDAATGASDPQAKQHYTETAEVLMRRLQRLRQFGQRRERVEALCHHCLSVLENLRLALAQTRLSGTAAGIGEVSGALERLNALQSELDCTADALRELERDHPTVPSSPTGPLAPEASA